MNDGKRTNRRSGKLLRLVVTTVAALPLCQVACTPDLLIQSFTNEIIFSATQFTFQTAQTIFANVFQI